MAEYTLHLGDCLDVLRTLPDSSIDSIVTDPPYGLTTGKKGGSGVASVNLESPYGRARIGTGNGSGGFMGLAWDSDVPPVAVWAECLRVLKPGGHLLAFAGTRTQHRMACRIEDAGFEIRDMLAWLYGSGFPKSRNIAEQDMSGRDTEQWQGWGTALKPSLEPITMARKPLNGTVAANVLAHGTGALNIDACRVAPTGERLGGGDESGKAAKPEGWARPWMDDPDHVAAHNSKVAANVDKASQLGRWPANLIHDGSPEVVALFPNSDSPWIGNNNSGAKGGRMFGGGQQSVNEKPEYRDAGSAARFFYCAKTSRKDRNEGLTDPGPQFAHENTLRKVENTETAGNTHPTVKPTDLMAYLLRLVTPAGGTALDPFMGSGSTGKAAMLEGFDFIGIDNDKSYLAIAEARILYAQQFAKDESSQLSLI